MTADEELLARLDVAKDFPLVGLSDLCVDAAARIRELIVQLEERETAAKKWHVQYDNAMEMLETERKVLDDTYYFAHKMLQRKEADLIWRVKEFERKRRAYLIDTKESCRRAEAAELQLMEIKRDKRLQDLKEAARAYMTACENGEGWNRTSTALRNLPETA